MGNVLNKVSPEDFNTVLMPMAQKSYLDFLLGESTLIAQAMQGEGPQGGNPPRPSATKGTTLLDRLH